MKSLKCKYLIVEPLVTCSIYYRSKKRGVTNCRMDESLELPTSLPKVPLGDHAPEDDQGSSDEEDGGLDWTKLL